MVATLERLRTEIASGDRTVPRAPTGALPPPVSVTVTQTAAVAFDGMHCRYDGPASLRPGDVLHVRFTNTSDVTVGFGVWTPESNVIWVTAAPSRRGAKAMAASRPAAQHVVVRTTSP